MTTDSETKRMISGVGVYGKENISHDGIRVYREPAAIWEYQIMEENDDGAVRKTQRLFRAYCHRCKEITKEGFIDPNIKNSSYPAICGCKKAAFIFVNGRMWEVG